MTSEQPSSGRTGSGSLDPYYENIDCSNEWFDLRKDDVLNNTMKMNKHWANKDQGGPQTEDLLALSANFGSIKLEDEDINANADEDALGNAGGAGDSNPLEDQENKNTTQTKLKSKGAKSLSKKKSPKKGNKNTSGSSISASAAATLRINNNKKKMTAARPKSAKAGVSSSSSSSSRSKSKPPAAKGKDNVFERLFGAAKSKSQGATPRSGRKSSVYRAAPPSHTKSARKPRRSTISSSRKVTAKSARKPRNNWGGLTKAESPMLHTKSRAGRSRAVQTSLEREMREVQKLHQEAEKRRRLNAKHLSKILVSKTEFTRRSIKPLTQPAEFTFVTASRLGYKVPKVPSVKKRKPRTSLKPTHPIPFSFDSDRRSKKKSSSRLSSLHAAATANSPYVPLQAKVKKYFQTKERTTSKSKFTGELTGPISPELQTTRRSRKSIMMTTEEKELAQMRRVQGFKARPINPKIFTSGGEYGVPRVEKKKPTAVKEFKLSRAKKHSVRKSVSSNKDSGFKARPFNEKIFKSAPKPKKAPPSLTMPMSPKLHTRRASSRKSIKKYQKSHETKEEVKPRFRYTGQLTRPTEFNLATEKRGKSHRSEFKSKLYDEQLQKQKSMKPKAQPMPRFKTPKKRAEVIRVTEPEPFHLQSVELSRRAREDFERKIQQEREDANRRAQFKAKDIKWDDNFFLYASRKPLTTAAPFNLHTEHREKTSNRPELERMYKEAELQKKADEEAMKRQQEEEDREWRRKCVHKPVPYKKSKAFKPRKSIKSLTLPQTPLFMKKKKQQQK